MISDDSGLCIKALSNKPGVHSARLAKRKGSFLKAMKFILKKLHIIMKNKNLIISKNIKILIDMDSNSVL